jgi:UDP-N-acetylmuramate--alanine ligase
MPAELDLGTTARVHVVGVGGAGMSALALLLAQMGHEVSGSDLHASTSFPALEAAGVRVVVGHAAEHVRGADWVTASPAVPVDNVELAAARQAGIDLHERPAVMGALGRQASTLAVAGTHGKTSTATMLSLIVLEAEPDASFLLGADVEALGANARWGGGRLLVVEADESYGAFAELEPWLVGITNVEADHLDHYGDLEHLEEAFAGLVARSVAAVAVADDAGGARVGRRAGARLVGAAEDAHYRVTEVRLGRAMSSFDLEGPHGRLALEIGAPGRHNVANAALAAALADLAGIGAEAIAAGLARFAGVPRRFEFRGEAAGVTFVDDYAHLPTEVAATLAAAANGGFERIVAVFQPHRFTRTAALAPAFAGAFADADLLVVTDVYGAGEPPLPGVSGELVADAVAAGDEGPTVAYLPERRALVEHLIGALRPGDLCLTLGAGDLTELPDELMERLR